MNSDLLTKDIWGPEEIEEAKSLEGPILLVGASGFIGAKMYYSLSRLRPDVFVISKRAKQSWRLSLADKSRIEDVDILHYEALKSYISTLRPKTVFNFSAYGAYARQEDTEKIHQTNYIGVLNLIRTLREVGCTAFVQAGSSSEYGLNSAGPKETDELVPNSDYSVSKIGASYLVEYYGRFFNFPGVNLRLYSAYGPFEERDRLIPALIKQGLKDSYPNFVNKEIARDFIYVDDCTNAFVKAALTACKDNPGVSVNVASGKQTTLEDVAMAARKVFKIKAKPEFGVMPDRKWDLKKWYGDTSFAKKTIGWEAKTSFEDGLKLSIAWEKKADKLLKYVSVPKKEAKLTAIFACYKDNESIPVLYERMTKVFQDSGYDYEIIFVNDRSPYDDEAVVRKLSAKDTHVIGVSHSRNFGSQSAFVSGMGVATGDAVILMDGDGQDPPEIIPEFIKQWEAGHEIVYGVRVRREAPLYMQMFYKLFYRVFKNVSDIAIPVDAGDFSLIDRKAVNYLLAFSEKDIFLRGLRAWVGFKQIGVPYERPERLFGKSTNNFQKNIWWAKKGIFSFSSRPLNYIQTIGFLFFGGTVLLGLYYLIHYFTTPPADASGVTTIIMLILILGSVQLISLSIIGDYIGKIIEEVKNRPKFIRDKILYGGQVYERDQDIAKILEEIKG